MYFLKKRKIDVRANESQKAIKRDTHQSRECNSATEWINPDLKSSSLQTSKPKPQSPRVWSQKTLKCRRTRKGRHYESVTSSARERERKKETKKQTKKDLLQNLCCVLLSAVPFLCMVVSVFVSRCAHVNVWVRVCVCMWRHVRTCGVSKCKWVNGCLCVCACMCMHECLKTQAHTILPSCLPPYFIPFLPFLHSSSLHTLNDAKGVP